MSSRLNVHSLPSAEFITPDGRTVLGLRRRCSKGSLPTSIFSTSSTSSIQPRPIYIATKIKTSVPKKTTPVVSSITSKIELADSDKENEPVKSDQKENKENKEKVLPDVKIDGNLNRVMEVVQKGEKNNDRDQVVECKSDEPISESKDTTPGLVVQWEVIRSLVGIAKDNGEESANNVTMIKDVTKIVSVLANNVELLVTGRDQLTDSIKELRNEVINSVKLINELKEELKSKGKLEEEVKQLRAALAKTNLNDSFSTPKQTSPFDTPINAGDISIYYPASEDSPYTPPTRPTSSFHSGCAVVAPPTINVVTPTTRPIASLRHKQLDRLALEAKNLRSSPPHPGSQGPPVLPVVAPASPFVMRI